jgi:2-amino-4-hydroxy-6-hydroxymethyldihydropteridine diphosphokinase
MSNLPPRYRYILAFGSNLGDRAHNCRQGIIQLGAYVRFLRFSPETITPPLRSPLYDTQDHEDYLNFIAETSSALAPAALYQCISEIEDRIGHPRADKWQPRKIDVDILLWARDEHQDFSCCTRLHYRDDGGLCIPHPSLIQRGFLLTALRDDFKIVV